MHDDPYAHLITVNYLKFKCTFVFWILISNDVQNITFYTYDLCLILQSVMIQNKDFKNVTKKKNSFRTESKINGLNKNKANALLRHLASLIKSNLMFLSILTRLITVLIVSLIMPLISARYDFLNDPFLVI